MVAAEIDRRLLALDGLLKEPRPKSAIERLSIERQIVDLRTGHKRGLVWDEDEAVRNVRFFSLLKHYKGTRWAGRPLTPEAWQEHCILAPLFGWYREASRAKGGVRRFRTGYVEIPRKNGKTTIASGLANQGLIADGEPGAEVYAAATKRDQATILFRDAQQTLGPKLRKVVKLFKNSIVFPQSNSTFQPLSSDYNSLDGLNTHRAVIDELHAHKTRDLFDVLLTSTGARQHPMILAITTAGFDRSSICWEQREEVRNILEGHKENDAYFGFVSTTDKDDDWTDPEVWWKANPNLRISLEESTLADECKTAVDSPAAENNFRRKHLNQWTEQAVRWLSMHAWDACDGEVDREELRGRECWAGLDLASTRDVNSLVLVFPFEGGRYKLLPFFWVPEDAKDERGRQDRTQVMNWASKGLIKKTEGDTVDYSAIAEDLMVLSSEFNIQMLGFDPWGPAAAFVQILQAEGFPYDKLKAYRQNISMMAAPTKEFERLVLSGKLDHGGNPVLRWMASNVSVKADSSDNLKPDKAKSADKIDGIVASIMALGLAMSEETIPAGTYYEDNELEML